MELVPKDTQEPMEDNSYLSDRAIFARDRQIERRLSSPKRRESLLQRYEAAFELIGGVPRLAIMGDEDPQAFMAQYIKLLAASQVKQHNHQVRVIQPSIPPTALDGDITDIPFTDVPHDDNAE